MSGGPRRLLLVSHNPDNRDSNAPRVYFQLLDALNAGTEWRAEMLHLEDFLTVRDPRLRTLASRTLLPRLISRELLRRDWRSYDVVMVSSGMAAPFFRRIGPESVRPLLVNHVHGQYRYDHAANLSEQHLGHWPTSLAYRAVTGPRQVAWDARGVAYADVVITQNNRDFGELAAERGVDRVSMIPPALYQPLHESSTPEPLPMAGRLSSLLWFGTWESRKGAYYLPEAYRLIRERFPDVTLTMGGTGKPAVDVLSFFDERDRRSVSVLGRVSVAEHVELMRTHGVFLFPSLSEGFGLAALEASAFGMVPVVTATGFGADHLRDGHDARVVFASSWHLAEAVCSLLADPTAAERMGLAARETARSFRTEDMVGAYLDVFARARKAPAAR